MHLLAFIFDRKPKLYPLNLRYTTVSQPDSIDGWLAVQLSDKLWFPCWNSTVMTDTAARIVPIVAAQERASLNSPLATTLSSHASSISAPSSTTDNVTAVTDSQTQSVTNASSVRMPPCY